MPACMPLEVRSYWSVAGSCVENQRPQLDAFARQRIWWRGWVLERRVGSEVGPAIGCGIIAQRDFVNDGPDVADGYLVRNMLCVRPRLAGRRLKGVGPRPMDGIVGIVQIGADDGTFVPRRQRMEDYRSLLSVTARSVAARGTTTTMVFTAAHCGSHNRWWAFRNSDRV